MYTQSDLFSELNMCSTPKLNTFSQLSFYYLSYFIRLSFIAGIQLAAVYCIIAYPLLALLMIKPGLVTFICLLFTLLTTNIASKVEVSMRFTDSPITAFEGWILLLNSFPDLTSDMRRRELIRSLYNAFKDLDNFSISEAAFNYSISHYNSCISLLPQLGNLAKTRKTISKVNQQAKDNPIEAMPYVLSEAGLANKAYLYVFEESFLKTRKTVLHAFRACFISAKREKLPSLPYEICSKVLYSNSILPIGDLDRPTIWDNLLAKRYLSIISKLDSPRKEATYRAFLDLPSL